MFGIYLRGLWRVAILLLGVLLAFGVVDKAAPFLHRHMPIEFVFLVLYLFIAYLGLPALIRLWRVFIKPNHLPVYVTTGDGYPSDPINIAIVCHSREQLINSMEAAGWTVTSPGTLKNHLKTVYAIVFNKDYAEATMSRLFLFNRPQDIAFQMQDGTPPSPRHRHHVRFWKLETPTEKDSHHDFWHNLMRLFVKKRSQIWIGAATHDVSFFGFRMRNFQITHKIDSNTNKERDFLIETLTQSNAVQEVPEEVTSGHELKFRGQTFGVHVVVDGRLKVVRLKSRLRLHR